jgi:hypothetical protein
VSAPLVIEHLDVIEQGLLGVGVALKALGFFALHRREPALHHRVVIAIAPAAHVARDSVRVEARAIVLARIRAALVGVMQQPRLGAPAIERFAERAEREVAVIHGTQRPADDEPGMQIHDGRQIQLGAAADEELRRVSDPALIRTLGDELSRFSLRSRASSLVAPPDPVWDDRAASEATLERRGFHTIWAEGQDSLNRALGLTCRDGTRTIQANIGAERARSIRNADASSLRSSPSTRDCIRH